MRVLIVDESAARGDALQRRLRLAGYKVANVLGAPDALIEAIEAAAPDVVVIDAETLKDLVLRLAQATQRLEERKLVERAKGLLMKTHGLDEEGAYRALRRMAMDQSRRIGEVARNVIGMANLLR